MQSLHHLIEHPHKSLVISKITFQTKISLIIHQKTVPMLQNK